MLEIAYIAVNGLLLLSFVMFALKRFREHKRKKKALTQNRRRPGQTPYRAPQRGRMAVPMYQPAHFDGERYRVENALNRDAILVCLTRNDTWAVEKPRNEE